MPVHFATGGTIPTAIPELASMIWKILSVFEKALIGDDNVPSKL